MVGQPFRARGIPEEWVEIKHDGIEGTTRVAPQAVAHWESRGWKAVDDKSKKPSPRAAGSES